MARQQQNVKRQGHTQKVNQKMKSLIHKIGTDEYTDAIHAIVFLMTVIYKMCLYI